jgi:hypothetical protein
MGIEFVDLSQDDSRVLKEAVGPDEEQHPIKVWFVGLKEPVAAKAVLTSAGIRLRATLPFLKLASRVRFAPADREEEQHIGTLREARMITSPGQPTVIEVEVGLSLPARGHVSRAGTGSFLTDKVSGIAQRRPSGLNLAARAPKRSRFVWAARWMAAGLILGAGILAYLELSGGIELPSIYIPSVPVSATAPVAEPEPAPVSEAAPEPAPDPAPDPAPPPAPAPRTLTLLPGRLLLPVDGSFAGMEVIRIGKPLGVVVTLPGATTPLAAGEHTIGDDAFRMVKVRIRPEGGIQLRVFFAYDPPNLALVERGEGLISISVGPR